MYVLHYKGKLLGTFQWENTNGSLLQGWRPAKKVYFSLASARSGARFLPKEIMDDIEIVEYTPNRVVEKYSQGKKEASALRNELKYKKRTLKYLKQNIELLKDTGNMNEATVVEAKFCEVGCELFRIEKRLKELDEQEKSVKVSP